MTLEKVKEKAQWMDCTKATAWVQESHTGFRYGMFRVWVWDKVLDPMSHPLYLPYKKGLEGFIWDLEGHPEILKLIDDQVSKSSHL